MRYVKYFALLMNLLSMSYIYSSQQADTYPENEDGFTDLSELSAESKKLSRLHSPEEEFVQISPTVYSKNQQSVSPKPVSPKVIAQKIICSSPSIDSASSTAINYSSPKVMAPSWKPMAHAYTGSPIIAKYALDPEIMVIVSPHIQSAPRSMAPINRQINDLPIIPDDNNGKIKKKNSQTKCCPCCIL